LGDLTKITNNGRDKFHVIVAADCLFFKDFHDDLIWLLRNALINNNNNDNGIVYLLQPKRRYYQTIL
jgi:hypothetical protein